MKARRPEVLAPAGDRAALEAAVQAGADAIYFGLGSWNARARATNFRQDDLPEIMRGLHRRGVKGYVALNTLVLDPELPAVEAAIRACAAAAVDAIIVQDLGVARLAREVAPALHLHASTQMTCTDADAVELAGSLGARRVVLARELSLDDIAAIRARTDVELEVFVHGALCIAYSGQCLTSEAIGGRSANRGACAQACRLPYELVVDGQRRDLGDAAYLLSPEDLEASALVPRLVALGVSSLKIEGRLKGPEYVAATTRLYRAAVSEALRARGDHEGRQALEEDVEEDVEEALEDLRATALQMYSRGSGPGFLAGIDHQRLVDGRTCEHHGLEIGVLAGTRRFRGTAHLVVTLSRAVARGDGLVVAGGREGKGEIGGRVWRLVVNGREVDSAPAGAAAWIWLGPEVDLSTLDGARRTIHRTSDPAASARARAFRAEAVTRAVDVQLTGAAGCPARLVATTDDDRRVETFTDVPLTEVDEGGALDIDRTRAQLSRLGGTPFHLRALSLDIAPGLGLPPSALNRARRLLIEALGAERPIATTSVTHRDLLARAQVADQPPPGGLFVLCRSLVQAQAALAAGAEGVYLDILELTGTGVAFRALTAEAAPFVGVAPPRIRKPGEEKIDRYLLGLGPAAVLVRGLGALAELDRSRRAGATPPFLAVGDFSLNVTNRLAAAEVLGRGLDVFTPAFDLDAAQLRALLDGPLGARAEVVLHHPMPLFHMEHCLIAALLSDGRDHLTCGRPCEHHRISLRDRAGMDHPVEADVGCRNTVFHAAAQSAADLVPALARQGVRRFRIELVRESPAEVARIVAAYRALIAGERAPSAVWRELRTEGGYGVVRGSLRVIA